tara:strand:- start:10238 stop:11098 length:861 start_codon:yes stop_codon:yes gene_type:complete
MSKKINLQLVINVLSLIQNNEKWNLSKLIDTLGIEEKELFYILSIVADIYSQHGELLIDYEYDEINQEFLFNINPSVKDIVQIKDGELFNIIFLLSSNTIYKELVKNNKDVEEFYKIVCPYFNLEILEESNDDELENLTFFEENVISYIKLGSTEETFYRIQPISLTSNVDGIVLEAIDLNEDKLKTFLLHRIVDTLSLEDFQQSKLSNRISITMKFTLSNKKILSSLNKEDYQIKNNYIESTFYSYESALNFALKHHGEINIISPQSLIDEIRVRNHNLKKKLQI